MACRDGASLQELPGQFNSTGLVQPHSFVTDAVTDRIFVTTNNYQHNGLATLTSNLLAFSSLNGSLLFNTPLCDSSSAAVCSSTFGVTLDAYGVLTVNFSVEAAYNFVERRDKYNGQVVAAPSSSHHRPSSHWTG